MVAGRIGSFALAALCLTVLVFWSSAARADGASLDGSWTLGPVSETFTVQQWSSACGPAPMSGIALSGGPVTVRTEGSEFVVSGAARTLRTDQCLDPLPTLARDAHSGDGKSWRTRCATPASDPRHAVVNTAYFSTGDDTISVAETGRYEFRINDARCVADVKREGTIRRVVVATPIPPVPVAPTAVVAPTAPNPTPAPPVAQRDCSEPGEPARLEVRPSRKLLRLGDAFAFRAVVLDARGCATATPIQWAVGSLKFKDGQRRSGRPALEGSGKLAVPTDDFADATFDVIATAAGRSARASVDVTSPATYEALLAQSGLDPNGERDEPSVTILATSSIGTTDVRAEDGARRRRLVFVLVIGGLTLILGVIALIGVLRARAARTLEVAAEARHSERMRDYERHKREREERHAAQMRAHLESVAVAQQASGAGGGGIAGPTFCPSCRREFTGGGAYCPFDSNRLVAVSGHEGLLTGPAGGVCPTCKRGFNPGVKVCPHDGDELVPAAAMAPPLVVAKGKICPTCGGRFEGTAAFCGKDGTQLVLLN